MDCRPGCGVCCITISISSPIPGMPDGNPAGVRCIHLTDEYLCDIFNHPSRPDVCAGFKPDILFCGTSKEEAQKVAEWMMKKD
jgi:uncharacterized protein